MRARRLIERPMLKIPNNIKQCIRIGLALPGSIAFCLSGLFARTPHRWIFGSSSNTFNDNAKALYIHVTENIPQVEAIWISGSYHTVARIRAAGGKAYLRWSPRGIHAALTGGYWFYNAYVNDINYSLSRRAKLFNLWHGIPLKKIEFDISHGPLTKRFQTPGLLEKFFLYPSIYVRPDWLLSTSANVTARSFATAFRMPVEACLNLGYPRNDILLSPAPVREARIQRWETAGARQLLDAMRSHRHTVIYMPTWRDASPYFLRNAEWDFSRLNEALRTRDTLLLLKLHVATPADLFDVCRGLSHIRLMETTDDVYALLPDTSMLLTDYSSIMFDYLLLDKPISYYPFDLDSYQSDSRGFYYPYAECITGRILQHPDDLVTLLDENLADRHTRERHQLRSQLFDHTDASASARIAEKILADTGAQHGFK